MFALIKRVYNAVKSAVVRAAQEVREAVSPKVLVLAGGAATGVSSFAQGTGTTIDVTDVVATITGAVTTLSSIGTAVLSLIVIIKLFKWAQRTL